MIIEIQLLKKGAKVLSIGVDEGVEGLLEICLVFRNMKERDNFNYYPKKIKIEKAETLGHTDIRLFRTIEIYQKFILDEDDLIFMLTHESEEIKRYLYERYPLTDELDWFYKRIEDDK